MSDIDSRHNHTRFDTACVRCGGLQHPDHGVVLPALRATQEEIAQQIGTTRKSVERRLSRVRRRARKLAVAGVTVDEIDESAGSFSGPPLKA